MRERKERCLQEVIKKKKQQNRMRESSTVCLNFTGRVEKGGDEVLVLYFLPLNSRPLDPEKSLKLA